MLANDELTLLIKSKYPVIFVESIDEEYVVNQLRRRLSRLSSRLFIGHRAKKNPFQQS
jgi:hypothetical protein